MSIDFHRFADCDFVVVVAATPSVRLRSVSDKQVKEKVSALGIQVENLCTMLPQASPLYDWRSSERPSSSSCIGIGFGGGGGGGGHVGVGIFTGFGVVYGDGGGVRGIPW